MNWEDCIKIGLTVVASLGGGGAIIAGFVHFCSERIADALSKKYELKMQKEEVIEAIDKIIDLENQKRSILSEYQDAILSYTDNKPLSLDFEECDYIRDLLTRAKEEINNYWDEEHEETNFDNEIAECLKLANK